MLELLDRIDKVTALSPGKAGELLEVALEPVAAESEGSLFIFRGHGGLWKNAELRLPRGGDGSRFVLVLQPVAPVSMGDVTAHFGKAFALEQPNLSAGAAGMYAYTYARGAGELRFAFPGFQDYVAKTILFARM